VTVGRLQVVFDCADPERVARFWAAALGYELQWEWDQQTTQWMLDGGLPPQDVGARSAIVHPAGAGPRLYFQRVPEGKAGKNRVHVDVKAPEGELATEVARLVGLGATVLHEHDGDFGPIHDHHVTLLDPEGNEFCVS